MKKLKILFIGNSHTYFHDMPHLLAERAKMDEYDCEVVMIAHGGWFLEQHVKEPDVRFNIKYGKYDYVVLQEHSHPFADKEQYEQAVRTLDAWIKEAGSKTVIYETWAKKSEPELQPYMNELHEEIAAEIGAILAPVGENWWQYKELFPNEEMYYEDGAHASLKGSEFAAKYIWEAILTEQNKSDFVKDRDLSKEGFNEGDMVSITFSDGEHWDEAAVVDNGFGKLVLRNIENEFAIAYPEYDDVIDKIE